MSTAIVAQMRMEFMATDTRKQGIVESRACVKAMEGILESDDIGPFEGKRPEVNIGPGSSRCQCGRCGLAFSSVSAFDKHQRLTKDGSLVCRNPPTLGMVNRDGFWGMPGPENAPWRRRDDK